MPTGLVYVVDDIIERVNPSFLGMLEASKEEVVGRDIHEFIEELEVETDTSEMRLVKYRRGDETLAIEYETEHVADRLFISTATVKTHLTRIYRKMGGSNRREAVRIAN